MSSGVIEDEVSTIPGGGEIIPPESAAKDLFVPNGLDKILAMIQKEVDQHQPDVSTEKGRKAIASLSRKVSTSMARLEDYGKNLSMNIKRQATDIDSERKRMKEFLTALRDKARKPLTDYEEAVAARVEAHEQALRDVAELGNVPFDATVADIQGRIAKLDEYALRNWEEFSERFGMANDSASMKLNRFLAEKQQQEEQSVAFAKMENERILREFAEREERQAREQAERDERIAREATERAERAAQEQVAQSEARARQAEAQRVEAEERAARDQEAAVEAERKRAEAARLAEEAATKAREENKAHRESVDAGIIKALLTFGVPAGKARDIKDAMAKGEIPNVKVLY